MIDNLFSLEGRTVLVTGASSGIGQASAVSISKMGGRVVALGRDGEKLKETLALLQGEGHSAHSLDLTDIGTLEARLAEICQASGPFGGVVHSAGITETTLLRDADFEKIARMMALNWTAFMVVAKVVCRRGRYAPGMSVVALASTAAFRGQSGMSFYSATKGALLSSVSALAAEYASRGIRFNCISPCHVDTPMHRTVRRELGEEWYKAEVEGHLKLGLIDPEDIANAIVFLLSDASKRMTGSNLVVDSGALLG